MSWIKKIGWLIFLLSMGLTSVWGEERPKIGLVLGGGGAKGFAHIPILQMLDRLDIPIDYIAGTSVGGILGALYAMGYSGEDIKELAENVDWEMFFSNRSLRYLQPYFEKKDDGKYQMDFNLKKWIPSPPSGLIYGQNAYAIFAELVAPYAAIRDFSKLPIPYSCVTVDLISGKEVILKKGDLARAMRATMAIPSIFTPVRWEDQLLIDGGVLNNLPIDVAKAMGADIVIAVDLGSPLKGLERLDSVDAILSQTLLLVETQQKQGKADETDIVIQPDLKDLGAMDFFSPTKLAKIKASGEQAAEKSLSQLLALKDKYSLSHVAKSVPSISSLNQNQKPVIQDIILSGNKSISDSFILKLMELNSGDALDLYDLNQKIQVLYSLGYFESLHYEVIPVKDNTVNIHLIIEEMAQGKLRLGMRYDNLHDIVAVAGVNFSNIIFPGLRFENELQFLGLTRFMSKLYYPSRSLNLPLYPIFQLGYNKVATRMYDGYGNRIARYDDKSWKIGLGLGVLLAKWLDAECMLQQEFMDIQPSIAEPDPEWNPDWKDTLRQFSLDLTIDTLDDVILPKNGLKITANYEGSFKELKSDVTYELFQASADVYLTPFDKHTLRLYGFWGTSSEGTPYYKYFNQGYPYAFVGVRYDQLYGNEMKLVRLGYRYELRKFIYIKLMGNMAWDVEQRWRDQVFSPQYLWGVGVGFKVDTPVGAAEMIFSIGSKSLLEPKASNDVFYLMLGTRF